MYDPTPDPMRVMSLRAPLAPCPSWCGMDHPAPGQVQVWRFHEHYTLETYGLDGTDVTVSATWSERIDGQAPHPDYEAPKVTVSTHTHEETTTADLGAGTAELLAEAMRTAGNGGTFADALAEAARLLMDEEGQDR